VAAELYDPLTGTWAYTGFLNHARTRFAGGLLANGKVMVAGGDDETNYSASAEIYDPAVGSWTVADSLNAPRNLFASALLPNGNLLAIGGENSSGFPTETEFYTSSNLTVYPPLLSQPSMLTGGTFQFSFTNAPDISFVAYASTDLSAPLSSWQVLSGPSEISPGLYQLFDAQAATNSRRFYRIGSP